jgi:processive 1,2-diacylglycerol beta-glucosyltransferase
MKIFFTHAKCGNGHTMAAKALYDALAKDKTYAAEMIDLLDESAAHRRVFEEGYRWVVTKAPWLWKLMYDISDQDHAHETGLFFLAYLFPKFYRRLLDEQPDVVVATHFWTAAAAARLKKAGRLKGYVITVITDYNVHKSWMHEGTDLYVVASAFTKAVLEKEYGVPSSKIRAWGIPLREAFYTTKHIPRGDRLRVLMFSSDFGMGPFRELVHALKDKCRLTVLCGRDEKLKSELKTHEWTDGLIVKGIVPDMWNLLAEADLVVLKAGGLSVTESLVMRRPMVFMKAIYGQETENIKFVTDHGVGFWPKSVDGLKDLLLSCIDDQTKLDAVATAYEALPRTNALNEFSAYIAKLPRA